VVGLRTGLVVLLAFVGSAGASETDSGRGERERSAARAGMVRVSGGTFVPLYGPRDQRVRVDPYDLDVYPVTNAEFFRFVAEHPRWQRGRTPALFADADYLRHWEGDSRLGANAPTRSPVTNVTWFAAKAYCEAAGKRLPTLLEWEFAARASEDRPDAADDEDFERRILAWYGRPVRLPLPEVGHTFRNHWGVWDLHGLVWEWVLDFNSVMLTGASRKDSAGVDRRLFCAAGSIGSVDPGDYAGFMRYAMRASVEARHAVQSLGFRCAQDASGD
jgi:formylglycine-generating enzyme required for sulfatase activity